MNTALIFNSIRQIENDHKLSQPQVDSTNAILDACAKCNVIDKRHIAYILATAYHESKLKPVEESHGSRDGRSYNNPDKETGQIYYGRGFVQLTHKANYQTFGDLLNVDLVHHPEMAMQVDYAAEIIVRGMKGGLFTGVGLSKYFNDTVNDAINARRIVNGIDCAVLIKGYYDHILPSLA